MFLLVGGEELRHVVCRVDSLTDNGKVRGVYGGNIGSVSGRGRVGSVQEGGLVDRVVENGVVSNVYGGGRVEAVSGSGVVEVVGGDGAVDVVEGMGACSLRDSRWSRGPAAWCLVVGYE